MSTTRPSWQKATEHTARVMLDDGLCFVRCYCGWKSDEVTEVGPAWNAWADHVDGVLIEQQTAEP